MPGETLPTALGDFNKPQFWDSTTVALLDAASLVRKSNTHNYCGLQIPLPVKFNMDAWKYYMYKLDYFDTSLIEQMRYGFPVNYTADKLPKVPLGNHASAHRNSSVIDNYLAEELDLHGCIGPFTSNPLDTELVLSPLQTSKKGHSGKLRTILDLSFPTETSVNSGIVKGDYCDYSLELKYPSIDNLVELIHRSEKPCVLWKADLSRAFRQIYVCPGSYHLLGCQFRGSLYLNITFPFGIRTAALCCQRITNAAAFIFQKEYGYSVVNYLDDFASCQPADVANEAYMQFLTLLSELGLQTTPSKCVPPSHTMTFLGIEINTTEMTLSIPQEKLDRAINTIEQVREKPRLSKRQIQSLIGSLMHISTCVRPGRLFVSRLINLLKANQFPVYTDREFILDLNWWHRFARQYNGISLVQEAFWSKPDAVIATDSCLTGAGGVFHTSANSLEYFHYETPAEFKDCDINILELLSLVIAVKLWAPILQRKKLVCLCDNQSVVFTVNTGKAHNREMQSLLRELWFLQGKYSCSIKTQHITSEDNRLPDHLSRLYSPDRDKHQQQFLESTAKLDITTTELQVPQSYFQLTEQPGP